MNKEYGLHTPKETTEYLKKLSELFPQFEISDCSYKNDETDSLYFDELKLTLWLPNNDEFNDFAVDVNDEGRPKVLTTFDAVVGYLTCLSGHEFINEPKETTTTEEKTSEINPLYTEKSNVIESLKSIANELLNNNKILTHDLLVILRHECDKLIKTDF